MDSEKKKKKVDLKSCIHDQRKVMQQKKWNFNNFLA